MNFQQLQTAIQDSQLSTSELHQLNDLIIAKVKANRQVDSAVAKAQLQPGMTVIVDHPKLAGKTLVLAQIKRTKGLVREAGTQFGGWNVPLNMIRQAMAEEV